MGVFDFVTQLQKALDQKLKVAEEEFKREAAQQDTSEKIYNKRLILEGQVDRAYGLFEANLQQQNQRFERERERILEKDMKRGGGYR